MFHQECSQCEQLCVGRSWSVGRSVSVVVAAAAAAAASAGGVGSRFVAPSSRATDRRTTDVRSASASLCLSARARRLAAWLLCSLALSLSPSLSGPRSTQRFTDRSVEGKDGRRKSYCSLPQVFYLQFDCTYFAPLSISGMLLTLTSNSICPFHRHRVGRKDINIEIFIAHQPICTAAVANANGGATGAVRFCTV